MKIQEMGFDKFMQRERKDIEDFLTAAFKWSETLQGHSYWVNVLNKYSK